MNSAKLAVTKATNNSVSDFLNSALKDIMSVLSAECGSLFIFDSENKELVLDSFHNSQDLNFKGLRRRIGEGITGKVVDIKTAVLVKDIGTDERFRQNGFSHYRTKSFISIPVFASEGLLALINVADKSSGESFTEQDLKCAETMVKYACMAIDSGNIDKALENGREDQPTLLEKYASVGKLAANLVHEINNPLDGVIRYTNMALFLLEKMESDSVAREYLTEAKKGLNRIANITKSLVEFSQLVNSRQRSVKSFVDINALLDDSLVCLKDKIHAGIRVSRNYSKHLPRIDDIGLSRVFINIIKNALDVMPEGGDFEISTGLKDSVVEISFRDTGTGIPSDIQQAIFEPFFSTKEKGKGTGLGLAISREIVNKYEGAINVASCFEKGTVFTISIPQKYLENV
ncbi:MAG: GAF domain-containing protein [Candidatus Omnitrophica bacterium]|nr:GAF domain-containing protein [Candidatus Omnitrophota bacterium]